MSEVLRIFEPNTQSLDELKPIMSEWSKLSMSEIRKIEVTFDDFKPRAKPLIVGDIYRDTNHYIKNRDSPKFPAHEIGDEGVLLTKYFGAIDKAIRFNVTVYRRESKDYRPINV